MGLAQSQFLGALAALAIPVIIHLMYRRRSRTVRLGTIRFLRVAIQENARRRRIKRWSLLAIRLACVGLLAMLFARPYLLAQGSMRGDQYVAVLIDDSASMRLTSQGTTLVDQAIAEARRLVQQGGDNVAWELAFFDQQVRPIGGESGRPGEPDKWAKTAKSARAIVDSLSAPEEMYGATDFGAALAWAHDHSIKALNQSKRLYVFTDLQRSGLDWTNVEPLPADVRVYVVDLGRALPNNIAVTGVHPAKSEIRPGEDSVRVNATLFHAGALPLEKASARLVLENGKSKIELRGQADLEPGASERVEFELPPLIAGLWQGSVTIDVEDELAFDNRRYFALRVAPPPAVLLVDGEPNGSGFLAETYFLDAALRLAAPGETSPDSPYIPVVASDSQAELPDLAKTELVVLANVAAVTSSDAARLASFVRGGGGLLIFTGENVQAAGYEAAKAAGLTAGEILGISRDDELPSRLTSWDREHPIFQPFNDPQHGDLTRLRYRGHTRIKPATETKVLATFRGGDPAILESRLGKGKVLWFASTCDAQWNDWAKSRQFVPVVHQMLGYLSGSLEGGPVRESIVGVNSDRPGVYEREGYWEVVNPSPRESEMDRCSLEEFATRFELKLDETPDGSPEASGSESTGHESTTSYELRDDEIWSWLALGLVGILLVESFIANRTAL